jgi:hypothetical protein
MTSFSEYAKSFRERKQELSPFFKPETNIPAKVLEVIDIVPEEKENADGDKYVVLNLKVKVETSDGSGVKGWACSSENLVTALEAAGIDVGSSFTVTKKGEGYHTKYLISAVKNAE